MIFIDGGVFNMLAKKFNLNNNYKRYDLIFVFKKCSRLFGHSCVVCNSLLGITPTTLPERGGFPGPVLVTA